MKLLVTGAAGFIGSNLSEYMLNKGHTVVAVDNFNTFYSPRIKEYNIRDFKDHKDFSLYRINIVDTQALAEVFESEPDIDAIIHLAAFAGVSDSWERPAEYVINNEQGTVNMVEMAVKYKVGNFIFASTSSLYGDNTTPFKETMNTDHPLAPYPATKKASEVMLSSYNRNFGLNTTILRIFNPLGPRLRPDLALPKLIRSCVYGQEFPQYWNNAEITSRDYTHIKHMFEGIEKILDNPFEYEIFNFGNSDPITLAEVIDTVENVTGRKANIKVLSERKGEMLSTYADISKAREMIGYDPVTTLAQSVQDYYTWFQQQEEWYKKGEY